MSGCATIGWRPAANTALHRTPAAAPPSPVSFQTFGFESFGD